MKYFVYKTTNVVNGKFYIGVHQGLESDNYLGSGLALKNAIKKYGREKFTRKIIQFCSTLEEAFELEKNILTNDLIKSKDCYNLNSGGKGGWAHVNTTKKKKFDNKKILWNSKNRKYFNDGQKTFRLYENDPRISNLFVGRLPHDTSMLTLFKWYNDGKKSFWLKRTDPKTKKLTEGRILSKNALESYKKSNILTGLKRKQKTLTDYKQNLKYCSICNIELSFEKRHTSTCSGKCAGMLRFKNRSLKTNQ